MPPGAHCRFAGLKEGEVGGILWRGEISWSKSSIALSSAHMFWCGLGEALSFEIAGIWGLGLSETWVRGLASRGESARSPLPTCGPLKWPRGWFACYVQPKAPLALDKDCIKEDNLIRRFQKSDSVSWVCPRERRRAGKLSGKSAAKRATPVENTRLSIFSALLKKAMFKRVSAVLLENYPCRSPVGLGAIR